MANCAISTSHCEQENNRQLRARRQQRERSLDFTCHPRRFIQGLAAGGAVAALDWGRRQAFGETGQQQTPATLTGKEFELTIDSLPVKFTGRHSEATAVNGSVPGPILRWREGDTVTVAVTNRVKVPTSIHWHGIRVPADMDGVPGLSFRGIAPTA
jgi:FtsP/CotA-like multicopper oxidase with cupredoxin domain